MSWNPFQKKDGDGKPPENQAELDAFLEKIGTSFADKIKPIADKVDAMENRWKALEEEAAAPPPTNNTDLTDEQKRAQREQALFAMNVQTAARLSESEAIASMSADWKHLIPEIKDTLAKTPIERKAQPDYPAYIQNVISLAVGRAAMKGGLRYDSRGERFFLEDKTSAGGSEPNPLSDPELTWTDPMGSGKTLTANEQLLKLGIDPKKFLEDQKRGVV